MYDERDRLLVELNATASSEATKAGAATRTEKAAEAKAEEKLKKEKSIGSYDMFADELPADSNA